MTNQKILDNAPDGATHVMGGNCYCMENTEYDYSEDGYDYLTFRNEDTSGRHRSLADIAKIAELENQWISVEDEMPSAEHAMVIVDFYGGNVGVGYPHKGKILDEPMGMLFNGVTHWMPLPKPPKQQE